MISRGDNPRRQIFKLQLPLFSTAENPPMLVYNKVRSIEGEIDITDEIRQLFPPGEAKIFAEGVFDRSTGNISLEGTIWPDPNAFPW